MTAAEGSYMATREDATHCNIKRYRDACSALLIDLNKCRQKNNYLNWKCGHERHTYEQCQYDDYIRRMKKLSKQKIAAAE
ncbi:hypothetical protein BT69DRAFT_932247 [Atractiella rhizophila]|nr:hypothetical protein BT69DRAFT_932247 [Atractiella rhizophila]